MAVKNRRTITSWGQAFPSISGGNEPAVPALLTSLGWLENRYSEDYLTEILRPNGSGDLTQWSPSAGNNYACVNEVTADDDASYVSASATGKYDLYTIDTFSENRSIEKVTINARAKYVSSGFGSGQIAVCVKTHGFVYTTLGLVLSTSYGNVSASWDNNPFTGGKWTVAEINDLQIGVCYFLMVNTATVRVTQLYAEVAHSSYLGISNIENRMVSNHGLMNVSNWRGS